MFDKEEFLRPFLEAKLRAYITKSTDPAKEKTLEELRAKMEEIIALAEKVFE